MEAFMEIEMKFGLEAGQSARLRRHPMLAGIRPGRRELFSQYLDTPDFALMKRGVAFRLRRVGYHWVQTLKAEARAVGALTSRPEWEMAVAGNQPDFAVLPPEALTWLAGIDTSRIGPVFVTEFRRAAWRIERAGAVAELALDLGEIRAGEAASPIAEVEIELKAGTPDFLFDLADELLGQIHLTVEPRGKAERGYRLAGATVAAPVRAGAPGLRVELDPGQPAGQAWAGIGRAALAQMVANLPGFLDHDEDIEYLHQLRIAARRLRAAAALRRKLAGPASWDAPLRGLMRALNPARDWDVFLHETWPDLEAILAASRADTPSALAAAETLRARIHAAAARARGEARAALLAPAFTGLVLAIGRDLMTPPETGGLDAVTWSADILDGRWKNLRKLGKGIGRHGPGGLHEVRIAAKKLRYAADALAPLHEKAGGRGARAGVGRFLKALATLQDELGQANDLHMAMQLLRGLRLPTLAVAFEAGRLDGILASRAIGQHPVSAEVWRRLTRMPPFWR